MQDKRKRTKKQIKVQDLKPKKDAKGGVRTDLSTKNHNANRGITGQGGHQTNLHG